MYCTYHKYSDDIFFKGIYENCSKVKTIRKKLKTPTLLNLLRLEILHKPTIERMTQWESTYNMFKRLLDSNYFCLKSADDIEGLPTSNNDWHRVCNHFSNLRHKVLINTVIYMNL